MPLSDHIITNLLQFSYEECLKQSLMVAAGINTNEKWESHGSDNGWIQNWKLYFDMDAI